MKRRIVVASVAVAALLVAGATYMTRVDTPSGVAVARSKPAPPTRAAEAATATAPAPAPTTRAQREPLVITAIRGRPVDTEGWSVVDFIAKVSPAARQGDAVVAYRVYKAESMCAQRASRAKLLAETVGTEPDDKVLEADLLARMNAACESITPAQMGERFAFLDQAIRAAIGRRCSTTWPKARTGWTWRS